MPAVENSLDAGRRFVSVISMGKDVHEPCCHTCELFGSEEAPPVPVIERPVLVVGEPKRLKILVGARGGSEREFVPTAGEVSVGRGKDNDIVLSSGTISRRQARFVFKDGRGIVVDLKSGCGTYVDGRKISSPVALREGSTVHMGDFVLRIVTE